MKPKSSLPCSQKSATGPYLEPDEFNPHLPTPSNQFLYFLRTIFEFCFINP